MLKLSELNMIGNEEDEYLVGVSYEIWDSEAIENDSSADKGWEVPYTRASIQEIEEYANSYDIHVNEKGMERRAVWDNANEPTQDEMTGAKTYFYMHVKHLDGSDLSHEERESLNSGLQDISTF